MPLTSSQTTVIFETLNQIFIFIFNQILYFIFNQIYIQAFSCSPAEAGKTCTNAHDSSGGISYAYATVESVDQCAQLCKHNNDCPGCPSYKDLCKGFLWIQAEKKCKLLTEECEAGKLSPSPGTDYYLLDDCSGKFYKPLILIFDHVLKRENHI